MILGPLNFSNSANVGDQIKKKKYEESLASINRHYAAKGWRVVHAAVDAAGNYVDCVLEKKAN